MDINKYLQMTQNKHDQEILESCINMDVDDSEGSDYSIVPEKYHDLLKIADGTYRLQDRNLKKQILADIETAIKEIYEDSKKEFALPYENGRYDEMLRIMLSKRNSVMNSLFVLDEKAYNTFNKMNSYLRDLTAKTNRKLMKIYKEWLNDEEEDWRNDCQLRCRIIAEGWKEELPTDETGSDYDLMFQLVEHVGRRNLYEKEFSGHPEFVPDDSWEYLVWEENYTHLFSGGDGTPFGDFPMCTAFENLLIDSLYSKYDILLISMFWADAAIIHQRIVNTDGELM